jgi:tetratricopeptide (TPR) repeat protein
MLGALRQKEDLAVSIALADALLGWLVASAGDRLVNWLRSDPTEAALRKVVKEAVRATVAEFAGDLDGRQVEHLHNSVLERDMGLGGEQPAVRTEVELRNAVHTWVVALDEARFGGLGYLTDLGVDPNRLADALADHIVAGIYRDGRDGGALERLATWLWRDAKDVQWDRIEEKIDASDGWLERIEGKIDAAEPAGTGLPGGTPDFIGRRGVLDELARRVDAHDPEGIVVAIHAVDGMAGVGKTELAVRAAHEFKHRYPDGQFFLDLHGYTEGIAPTPPAAALEELLRQAGVPGAAVPPDLAGRQARWRSLMAKRRALVLLDNALDADQVRPLLPVAAGCLVLITSRRRLRELPGGKPLGLDVLPHDDAVELFTRLVGTSRQLDWHAVATVVDLVDRLPLAVQAVAGLIDDSYTETDLSGELTEVKAGIGLLDQDSPLGAGVRAAFETSLRRLDTPHRDAFRLLGVHPGPSIGVPQFAALADLPIASARARLRGLADRNLISTSTGRVGHQRYQLHDLMRAFIRGQATLYLSEQDQVAAIGRLTTWYATAMTAVERLRAATGSDPAESGVEGFDLDRPAAAHRWIAAEQDNLLAYARAATGAAAAGVCRHAARNLYYLDHHATARVLYETAATLYGQAGERAGEAAAWLGLGDVARLTGEYLVAAEHYRAAEEICADIGDHGGEASARRGLGDVARATGDNLGAADHLQAARSIFAEIGDRGGEAYALCGLGNVALYIGDEQGAADHLGAAQRIFAEIGDRRGEASALLVLGYVARATGDYPEATKQYHRAAQTISVEIGYRGGEGDALLGLGYVARATGDYPEATKQYRAAKKIFAGIGNRNREAYALRLLGHVARATGDYPEATKQYRAAQTISVETGDQDGEAAALLGLGDVAEATGDYPEATKQYRAAQRSFAEIGNRNREAYALRLLGHVARATGDYPEATKQYRAAQTISVEIGDQDGEAAARWGLGRVALATGDYPEATKQYRAAQRSFAEIGNQDGEAVARWGLGRVALATEDCSTLVTLGRFANSQGRVDEARAYWEDALRVCAEIDGPAAASVRDLLAQLGRN